MSGKREGVREGVSGNREGVERGEWEGEEVEGRTVSGMERREWNGKERVEWEGESGMGRVKVKEESRSRIVKFSYLECNNSNTFWTTDVESVYLYAKVIFILYSLFL